jgi:hypothetical protein
MIQVNTQLSQQDFIRFNYGHFFRQPVVRLLLAIFGFVFIVSLFGVVVDAIAGHEDVSLLDQSMPVIIISAIFAFIYKSVHIQSKRNYASTNSVHEPITYTFSDSGIHSKGRTFEADLSWELVHKVHETKSWFAFYQSNVSVNLIPKASFENEEQIKALRELIASQPNLNHKLRKG